MGAGCGSIPIGTNYLVKPCLVNKDVGCHNAAATFLNYRVVSAMIYNFRISKLFSACLILFATSAANGQTYLGELCWEIVASGEEEDSSFVKLAITDMTNNHFIANGIGISESGVPSDIGDLYNGNAEIVGEQVIFSLTGVGDDLDEITSTQLFVRVDLGTLDGSFNAIQTLYDKPEQQSGIAIASGTITNTACP